MSDAEHRSDELRAEDHERIAAYVLGSLAAEDTQALEAHLARCATCRGLVHANEAVIRDLALCAPAEEPPADLEARLLHNVRAQARTFETRDPAQTLDRSSESYFLLAAKSGWEPTRVRGVECRTLNVDRSRDRATMLFRMAPGASYPAHRHSGAEECLVLSGDLQVGDVCMREGDYQFAAAGSEHGMQSTANGCVLLISTSLSDEIL